MTVDVGASPNSSSSSAHVSTRQSATIKGSSDHPTNDAICGPDSPSVAAMGSATATSSPRRRDSNLASRIDQSLGTALGSVEGSILGKRSAATMEGTGHVLQDPCPTTEQTAKPRQQAIDQVISSVFRRSSMISPMDSVGETSSTRSYMETSPSSRHHAKLPPPASPLARSPGSKMASISTRNPSDASNYASDEGQLLPSLPGFKSLFGSAEQGERPTISRNSSSGFPDLRALDQTLKPPLTIATIPYNITRGSRDSGTTASSTAWSARSSATRETINLTAPSSAAVTAASLPSGSWNESLKYHGAWSVDLSNRGDPNDGSINGLGLSHTTANNGDPKRIRPIESAGRLDLAKRPSYTNFGAEMEERRVAAAAAEEAQEAWRRQSDNAAVLSAERRRLMGSSVAKHASELELAIGVALPPPAPKMSQGVDGKSVGADDALLAARTRLLRYESYPFGSKDAENDRLAATADSTEPYRRQSMFPEPSEDAWDSKVISLTHSSETSTSALTQPSSPARKDVIERRPYSSVGSQRDLQFEEIVRKASVDLAKRSATPSLTGTPVGAFRPLLLSYDSREQTPLPAGSAGRVSEAELANAREREQRRRSVAVAVNKDMSEKPHSVDARSVASEAPLSPQQLELHLAVPATNTQLLRHSHQPMDVNSNLGGPGLSSVHTQGRVHSETTLHSTGPTLYEGEQGPSRPRPRRVSPSSGPRFTAGEPSSGSLPLIPPFGHRVRAGHHHQGFHQPLQGRGSPSTPAAGPTPEMIIPYYDNPSRTSSGASDSNSDFPSVLRRDYQPVALDRPMHNFPPPTHLPLTAAHPAHYNSQHMPPPPQQYGLPPQHFHGPWGGDPRMAYMPAPPPVPNRMLSAPTVLGLNNATLPGPRYICEHCGKSFSRPSSLKIHIYSHTGEKPYKCTWPNCTRSFSVQSNLKRHAKVHLENSGQQSTHLGDPHHNALSRVPEGNHTPGTSLSTSYRGDFLTPQTGQPLPSARTPEDYFDARLHTRHPASHSPAPSRR